MALLEQRGKLSEAAIENGAKIISHVIFALGKRLCFAWHYVMPGMPIFVETHKSLLLFISSDYYFIQYQF